MIARIDTAARESMKYLDVLDGHCLDVCIYVSECVPGARLKRYDRIPNHPGPHYTVLYRGREYDPTVGFADWSRGLRGIARGRIYTVNAKSPHRRWK